MHGKMQESGLSEIIPLIWHLSYLGPISCFSPSWSPLRVHRQGAPSVWLQRLMPWWQATFVVYWMAGAIYIFCPQLSGSLFRVLKMGQHWCHLGYPNWGAEEHTPLHCGRAFPLGHPLSSVYFPQICFLKFCPLRRPRKYSQGPESQGETRIS